VIPLARPPPPPPPSPFPSSTPPPLPPPFPSPLPTSYLYPPAIFSATKPIAKVDLGRVRIVRTTIITSGATCLCAFFFKTIFLF
jgi:hypothetical protein